MSLFIFEQGISTERWPASLPFLIRVSISAITVRHSQYNYLPSFFGILPACFSYSRYLAFMCQFPKTYTANTKLPYITMWSTTYFASVISSRREFWSSLLPSYQRFFLPRFSLLSSEQRASLDYLKLTRFFICFSCRYYSYIHTPLILSMLS